MKKSVKNSVPHRTEEEMRTIAIQNLKEVNKGLDVIIHTVRSLRARGASDVEIVAGIVHTYGAKPYNPAALSFLIMICVAILRLLQEESKHQITSAE